MSVFSNRYGPWAVITGAARGLGEAFAKECASLGMNVILIDVLASELEQTAAYISSTCPIKVKTIIADLSDPFQVKQAIQECESYHVGFFCCNHAASHLFADGKLKFWLDTPLQDLRQILQINLSSSLEFLFYFAQKMRSQSRGGIVLVSSGACLGGAPYLGQYAATKAFLTNLGETLWWELKRDGIDVTTVMPGLTKTPGMLKFINSLGEQKMPMMLPCTVAKITLSYLGKGPVVIPGWRNKLQSFLTTRLLPKKWNISFLGKVFPQFFHVLNPSKKPIAQVKNSCQMVDDI